MAQNHDYSAIDFDNDVVEQTLQQISDNWIAFLTCHSGSSAPSGVNQGAFWLDTSSTPYELKQLDSSDSWESVLQLTSLGRDILNNLLTEQGTVDDLWTTEHNRDGTHKNPISGDIDQFKSVTWTTNSVSAVDTYTVAGDQTSTLLPDGDKGRMVRLTQPSNTVISPVENATYDSNNDETTVTLNSNRTADLNTSETIDDHEFGVVGPSESQGLPLLNVSKILLGDGTESDSALRLGAFNLPFDDSNVNFSASDIQTAVENNTLSGVDEGYLEDEGHVIANNPVNSDTQIDLDDGGPVWVHDPDDESTGTIINPSDEAGVFDISTSGAGGLINSSSLSSDSWYELGYISSQDGTTVDVAGWEPADPYNLNTLNSINNYDNSGDTSSGTIRYGVWNSDGTKLFATDSSNNNLIEYDASTPYRATSSSLSVANTQDLSSQHSSPVGIEINSSDDRLWIMDQADNDVEQWDMTTPNDSTSLSHNGTYSVPGTRRGIAFNESETAFYVAFINSSANDQIEFEKHTMTTSGDVTTASLDSTGTHSSSLFSLNGIDINDDETKLVIASDSNFQMFSMTSGDVSTVNREQTVTHNGGAEGVIVDDDDKFYWFDFNNDRIVTEQFGRKPNTASDLPSGYDYFRAMGTPGKTWWVKTDGSSNILGFEHSSSGNMTWTDESRDVFGNIINTSSVTSGWNSLSISQIVPPTLINGKFTSVNILDDSSSFIQLELSNSDSATVNQGIGDLTLITQGNGVRIGTQTEIENIKNQQIFWAISANPSSLDQLFIYKVQSFKAVN